MWLLIDEAGFNDRESGWIFAAFGLTTAIFTMALGPLVDRLLVRKSLYIVLVLGVAVSIMVAVSSAHRIVILLCLFIPLPVAVGLASPVIQIAIRRYTTPDTQSLAFATQ
jgi:predicted MFS family arabinose efflux permease